jgi:tetratricopeptide (TPR) repeat protein
MKAPQHQTHRKARARLRLARDRIARADYGSAILFLRSALKRLEKEPASASDRAQCYIELARCYNLQGEHDSAIPYCRWALNLLRQEWDAELAQAEAEMELGIALLHTGEWRQAQRYLARSYQTFEAHHLWAKAARCVENIGTLAKRQEQIVRAINAFSYARHLYRQVEDLAGVHRTESQLRELIPKE